jgi:CP family cyanate transporter-like MFS transporter
VTSPTPQLITTPSRPFLLRHGRALILIVLIAINLRPAVTGVAPLLADIRSDLGLSNAAAGALTTLPVLCFGFFGLIAPSLTSRVREEVLLAGSMALLIVGIFVRSGPWQFTLFTGALLVGLAISVGNVAAPALIKRNQPESVTFVTAVYTTAVTLGAAVASGIVVPIQESADSGWRLPLVLLAAPAVLAGVAWAPRAVRAARRPIVGATVSAGLWRDRLAWQVTGFMGLQSLLAYVVFAWLPTLCQDRGMGESEAGLVLAVSCLVQATGSLLVPAVDRHLRDQRPIVLAVVVLTAVGFVGIAWAPVGLIWVSAVVLGLGQGAGFALALAFIGLRSGDARMAARLSGMAQGVGYLIAAIGPFAIGLLHDLSNGWTVPVVILIAIALLEGVPGMTAGRARTITAGGPATVVE